ncbi:hypothetical protein HY389_00845 [Candidatus Daviesbacteria bacterium]|nr:hypothetical protein [Candidatus Daviesbacteria bacterium]
MTSLIVTNIYIFIMATVLAVLEIQIEGQFGWAKNLPTWRPKGHEWYAKLYAKIMSGKELTGYHATMFAFVFLVFHLPYVFGLTWTLEHWISTLSLFFIFIALWDYLWFVLNPHFPIRYFAKNNPNHKNFFLGVPLDYYFALGVSILILIPAFLAGYQNIFTWWIFNVGLFAIQLLAVILFSLYVLKIDNWIKTD